jgi:type II secretory pathway component PulF
MKKYKFYLMGICTILFAYIIPIFAQWYKQQTGIYPALGITITVSLAILGWAYEILKEFE